MNEEIKAFEPIDLSPELQRAARLKDMLLMRNMDITPRYEIINILLELNLRYTQYVSIFNDLSRDYRILQTIQDFNRYITPLQIISRGRKSEVDQSKPIASMKDGTFIYTNVENSFEMFVIRE